MNSNGWLNINKPIGYSSAQIVAGLKRKFQINKIGHTGTLDPLASGVLPVAIGEATKLSNYLMDAKKLYRFTIQFGEQRDTGDLDGQAIATSNYIPSKLECENVTSKFIGCIEQIPPQYSALKVNGVRAYKLARSGCDVKLLPRIIHIYSLDLIDYYPEKAQATFVVECSKGTYIRTLAEDIAKSLQSYGFVIELARLMVGLFKIEDSFDFQNILEFPMDKFLSILLDVDKVLDGIPVLDIDEPTAACVRYGQKNIIFDFKDEELIWLRCKGLLVAIGNIKSGLFHSIRVFNL